MTWAGVPPCCPQAASQEVVLPGVAGRLRNRNKGYCCVEGSTLKNVEIEMKWALPRPGPKRPLPRVATRQQNELTAENCVNYNIRI